MNRKTKKASARSHKRRARTTRRASRAHKTSQPGKDAQIKNPLVTESEASESKPKTRRTNATANRESTEALAYDRGELGELESKDSEEPEISTDSDESENLPDPITE